MKWTTETQRRKFLRKWARIERLKKAWRAEVREFFGGDGTGHHSQCCPLGGATYAGLNGATGTMPCACGAGDDNEDEEARAFVEKEAARKR